MKTPRFTQLFGPRPLTVIGMIHVAALPGTPRHRASLADIVAQALAEANIYRDAGIHALMLENMHDIPYVQQPGTEVTAAMAVIAREVKRACPDLPLGVQILAGGNRAALAVALAAGADFIRAEAFVFGHVADEGYMDSCAGDLLRYRKAIGAEQIAIFTDIKKKHSAHAITADVDIVQTAQAAEFSDGRPHPHRRDHRRSSQRRGITRRGRRRPDAHLDWLRHHCGKSRRLSAPRGRRDCRLLRQARRTLGQRAGPARIRPDDGLVKPQAPRATPPRLTGQRRES